MLYESLMHPLTILSTLPPASVGAILALLLTDSELDVMSIIGIILLIGIVKKNAIMMIDFALNAERNEGKNTRDSIFEASMLRFRPDPDDHHGGAVRRGAAGDRHRHGIGAAPAAGNFDHRRPDREPGADALHHPVIYLFMDTTATEAQGSTAMSNAAVQRRPRAPRDLMCRWRG